jgi:hypothetical protein
MSRWWLAEDAGFFPLQISMVGALSSGIQMAIALPFRSAPVPTKRPAILH